MPDTSRPPAATHVTVTTTPSGLVYTSDDEPGIRRLRRGKGFSYRTADGASVRDRETLARIRALAIPPAWTDVWISPSADTHLQATGRDQKGRKQYRYHADFSVARSSAKFEHVMEFAALLPTIRARTASDLRRRGLPREKVLAAVVRLLEQTLIRVGNDRYARENRSFGLTTLRARHVAVEGGAVRFDFKGKSGRTWRLAVSDRRLARVVRSCQELPGQRLFQYVDADGRRQAIGSADVNAYLHEITGADVTAKDFRTWAGTVLAALALAGCERPATKRETTALLRRAIERVAGKLGNTPAICRKSYVHPEILSAWEAGALELAIDMSLADAQDFEGLEAEELAVLAFLKSRTRPADAGSDAGFVVPAEAQAGIAACG